MATSYTNPCGSGARQTLVILTSALSLNGAPASFLDGNTTANAGFFQPVSTANILEFWFPSKKIIDEAKFYQQSASTHGTWKWQGSNDRTTWTDLGGTFTLGGVATQTLTTLAGNTTAYIFYRLLQVSGNASSSPWLYEFEFKIDEGGTTSYLNPLGSGNRTATIGITESGITWGAGSAPLINGTLAQETSWNGSANAGHWVRFDLTAPYVVQEARLWMGGTIGIAQGDWKLQGSPDAAAWTDLSGTLTLAANLTTHRFGGFAGNTTAYRYYRLLGVSGTRTVNPYLLEIEFMVAPSSVVAAVATAQPYVLGPL